LLERREYEGFRVSPVDPATIRVETIQKTLAELASRSAGRLRLETFAESFEGRRISMATIGSGPTRVLMWSQMHGDEPTHTAVVLDLLSYLLRSPAEPLANEILANCTLHIIPMLNPDGAQRTSRFNAQGIDVNRDARRLATPEGRALRRAVETLKPEFGFNLHNQNARTAVGEPPKPAAVSVLAPSADAAATSTPHMRRARQLAACFVDAVKPHAEGMISRYDDEFEPRAFGDTIQASGVVTMLVEAGGWPGPDPEPLVRLHFHGMLATLHAIATGRIDDVDPAIYESLPESNSRNLFDLLIRNGHILDAQHGEPFVADLGVDHSHGNRIAIAEKRDGRIVEIGDLSTTVGKAAVDAADCLVLPGRTILVRDWSPTSDLNDKQLAPLLSRGTTCAIGVVDLANADAIEAIDANRKLPINWAFVGRLETARNMKPAEDVEHVALAAARGLLAVLGNGTNEAVWQQIDRLGLPLLQLNQLPSIEAAVHEYRSLAREVENAPRLLKLNHSRGKVARGQFADLQMFELDSTVKSLPPVDWARLKRVVVAGETVWKNGQQAGGTPGAFIRGTSAGD
jgi:hypothetical protein